MKLRGGRILSLLSWPFEQVQTSSCGTAKAGLLLKAQAKMIVFGCFSNSVSDDRCSGLSIC